MKKKDIEYLANLARIDINEDEKQSLLKDVEEILGFVGQIQSVATQDLNPKTGTLRNVMREDENPHEPGIYTDTLLEATPARRKGYVAVKKIL